MINKKRIISKETREKMSLSQVGRKHSDETKEKIGKSNKGKRKGMKASEETKKKMSIVRKGKNKQPCSEEAKKKISIANSGRIPSIETRRKISMANLGKKRSVETRMKMSLAQRGEKGSNWQKGVTEKNDIIRQGIDFRLWREAVFARDNWTCQKCRERGGKLHPHHIKNFAQYIDLRFAIDNGITFCKKCHKEFHKIYRVKNNTREQLEEFLKD